VERPRLAAAGGLTLGFGLGGLADGIVLHHVLQWHNLVSDVVARDSLAGLERNVFWDGVFHLATLALLLAGAVLLWRADAGRVPAARVAGLVLVGWGAFHAVDQLLFHLALGLHDMRQDAANAWAYNWGFFAVGLAVAAGGALLLRRSRT